MPKSINNTDDEWNKDDWKREQIKRANAALPKIKEALKGLNYATVVDLCALILSRDSNVLCAADIAFVASKPFRSYIVVESMLHEFYPNLTMQEAIEIVLEAEGKYKMEGSK